MHSKHCMSQPSLGRQSQSLDHCPQLPQGPKEGQLWNQQSEPTSGRKSREAERKESREIRAFPRDRERRERNKLQRDEYMSRNRSSEQDAIKDGNTDSTSEHQRDPELVRPKRGERTRNHSGFDDRDTERRCATRGNEDRRLLRISPSDGTEEREGEREDSLESFWDCYRVPIWERTGGELEDSYCRYSRRERDCTDAVWPQDARNEKGYSNWTTERTSSWETSEQAERVEEDWGRQTSEPLYKSSMEKSPIPNLTRGEKTQTRISRDNGNDEQLFIPFGGGIEGRGVVQSDIYGPEEERKVEEDSGLQYSKRGSARKTLQDGFPGDSGGTPGGERLDDYARHIDGRAIQSLSVLQLSKSLLRLRGDVIWGKGRAQSIHEDNETGSVIYQRAVESEISNIPGRHSPNAPRQGSFEIVLTGDSPVPEKSWLDTVGRVTEVGTRKERGVSGMELEFREDGSDAPKKEESAAPGGCAKMDSTCKEEEETKDEGLSSTPREAELRATATPTSELVDETHAIRTEAGNSPRGLEGNGDRQPNDVGRINTLEEDPAREQTEVSEEKKKASRVNNRRV
ncbi:uncharacterized protein MONOS_11813 [Monocercomonoides exilis]|uniref:uncharacterized protein n=1 Tax=Monocercomonoides exilis TaxID=2049356 RepID=UPI0035594324|nr:hypothetical protein MONOS_11813 [Monocercomonoides exilis]|eukprot:MONOS_11813.1-p1 / transcript=MONOS_11813.1 / gene=MONOS_11813 / organism=Monocercomonoides_exilis_PA203 / gene_product=unspecified product / transcript_product=unspecified product / location=Mono_scaffold00614:25079-26943(-) / protein_length=571 / sequence_SO=supercontig / SO=protein_coding / is_pseudo=false